jgi:hypothetical protein
MYKPLSASNGVQFLKNLDATLMADQLLFPDDLMADIEQALAAI